MHKRFIATTLTTASALVAAALAGPQSAQAAPTPKAIPHTKPAWLDHAHHLGHASPKAPVTARVYLAPQAGLAALQRAATAVSTPGSASYGKFLTPTQYQAAYAATSKTVGLVESWLKSDGLKIAAVEPHHRYVTVRGTVAAAQRAFGASIDRYRKDGLSVQAPTATLTAPASLAPSVLTVIGLDTSPRRAAPASSNADAPPPASFQNARPCSLYFGQVQATYQRDFKTKLPKFNGKTLPYAPCGYSGPQLHSAYAGDTALDGSGVTVAVVDAYAAPTIKKDASTYATNHGDRAYAPGQFTQVKDTPFTNQAASDPSGWYGEETLDVEAVHAMAPGANVRYYGASSCSDADLLDTLGQVVTENKARLVTNSWGDTEADESADNVAAYEQVFLQGAMQGISFTFSSGDDGDELVSSGLKQADYPTSDPYVTSVGGTSTAIGQTGALSWQSGWGTDKYKLSTDGTSWTPLGYLYGAGGGNSALFDQPQYQAGVAPGPTRQVPDVAMDADPNTGMLIGETQTFPDASVHYGEYRIGGTSLASPLFAGMTALALQHDSAGVGLLNPTIYGNATTGAFTDVKGQPKDAGDVRIDFANGNDGSGGYLYSVRTFGQDSSLKTSKGWDNVTGLGSPNAGWLTAVQPAP